MPAKTFLICQNTACRKAGSAKVLAAFQALMAGSALSKMGSGKPISEMTDANPTAVSKVTIVGCCCLGQCGNGPMVLVMPDQAWYRHVRPDEATAIMQWHQQDQL